LLDQHESPFKLFAVFNKDIKKILFQVFSGLPGSSDTFSGRICQFNVGEMNHTVKAECRLHKKCQIFKQAKKLPFNCEQRIMDWFWVGYMRHYGDKDATAHKSLFEVATLH
jgi:hypothetical protein